MPSPQPTPLAIAIATGDLAGAIRALDTSLGGGSADGAGPSTAASAPGRASALANRALCHERLGMHRKAIKVRAAQRLPS